MIASQAAASDLLAERGFVSRQGLMSLATVRCRLSDLMGCGSGCGEWCLIGLVNGQGSPKHGPREPEDRSKAKSELEL